MGTIVNGRNKMLDVRVLQKNIVKVLGDTPAKETVENYIPMMTWEDWHLLQELHKARDVAMKPQCRSSTVNITLEGDPLEIGKRIHEALDRVEGVPEAVHHAIDKDEAIAELEAKCRALEQQLSDAKAAAVIAIDLKDKYLAENRQLSKSLQHYRNAFFSDKRDNGGVIPVPAVQK